MKQLTLADLFSCADNAKALIHSFDNVVFNGYSPVRKSFTSNQYTIVIEHLKDGEELLVRKMFRAYATVPESLIPIYRSKIERLLSEGILDGYPIEVYSRHNAFAIYVDMYKETKRHLVITAKMRGDVK